MMVTSYNCSSGERYFISFQVEISGKNLKLTKIEYLKILQSLLQCFILICLGLIEHYCVDFSIEGLSECKMTQILVSKSFISSNVKIAKQFGLSKDLQIQSFKKVSFICIMPNLILPVIFKEN